MKRLRLVAAAILIAVTLFFALDYYRVNANDARVASIVRELGGRFGSIPTWPLGAEYQITFQHPLSDTQLRKLEELNNLRGSVGVQFTDCELSPSQQADAIRLLDCCHIYWNRSADANTVVLNTPD